MVLLLVSVLFNLSIVLLQGPLFIISFLCRRSHWHIRYSFLNSSSTSYETTAHYSLPFPPSFPPFLPNSFVHVERWLSELRENASSCGDKMVIMLVGNKCDRENRRAVSTEEGEAFAREHGLLFIETSAKTRVNVDQAFTRVAEAVYEKIETGVIDPADESVGIRFMQRGGGIAGGGGGKVAVGGRGGADAGKAGGCAC